MRIGLILLIVGFAAIGIESSAARDLNAPLNDKPTVGSELQRGFQVAFQCGISNAGDSPGLGECVDRAVSEDQQKHPDYLPFEVGAFWGECVGIEVNGDSVQDRTQLSEAYGVFRNYQDKLGVSDAQLVASQTEMIPTGRKSALDQLKRWRASPPKKP